LAVFYPFEHPTPDPENHLQAYQTLQQEVAAHASVVEAVAAAAADVVATTGDPQVSQQLYNVKHDYRSLKLASQVMLPEIKNVEK
jgi:hypothetical protein